VTDNYMMINGARYPVINAWVETDANDGRKRWGIVTEGEEQPAAPAEATAQKNALNSCCEGRSGLHTTDCPENQPAPAGATAPDQSCKKCGRTFVDDGKFVDSAAQSGDMPFCKTCVSWCHDTEIADHWCMVDQWRQDEQSGMPVGEPAPPADATAYADFIRKSGSFLEGFRAITEQVSAGNPADDPITPEEHAQGAQWIERPSGPPVRVDGPGCTPVEVPNDAGDMVRTGSLYADKCAECTTGVSCEDAGRCLFEG